MSMSNFYEILGCPESASYDEIKKSYQYLVRQSHPDKVIEDPGNKQAVFIQLTEAWNTLRDPKKRKAYDAQLLLEKCNSESLLFHNTISWDELCCDGSTYSYPCRCGNLFSVPLEEREESNLDFVVQCTDCSFHILIKKS